MPETTVQGSSDWAPVNKGQGNLQAQQAQPANSDWQSVTPPSENAPSSTDTGAGLSPGQQTFENVKNLAIGAGKGLESTIEGGGHLIRSALGMKQVNDLNRPELQTQGTAQKVGYGGETLLEFLAGDTAVGAGAGKVLSYADKLGQASKIAKILESSPKLMKAVEIGAQALKAGGVQGAQTLARTGGDVGAAAKDAAIMGGTAGVLGTVGAGVSALGGKLATGAEASENLTNVAKASATKPQVADVMQDYVEKSKQELHQNYENKINDLTSRASGTTIDPAEEDSLGGGHPAMSHRAAELLRNPIPSDHQLVSDVKSLTGEKLDGGVKNLLRKVQTGYNEPEEFDAWQEQQKGITSGKLKEVDGKVYDAAKYDKWESEKGVSLEGEGTGKKVPAPTSTELLAEPQKLDPYDLDQLIKLRQEVRKAAQAYEPGNINSRTLVGKGSLTEGIDDTIGQLTDKVPDTSIPAEYKALRDDYRSKVNIYDTPIVKNLRIGKYDDAAKDILSGNTSQYKIGNLRTILGDERMDDFGHKVFGNMLQDAQDANGQVNAAKLVKTWSRLPDETKAQLFRPEMVRPTTLANQDVNELMKDAKTAANIQYLSRAGILGALGAVGATAGHLALGTGLGTLLGLTMGEGGGGILAGRGLLDYVANHPNTWKALRAAGEAATSGATAATGKAVVGATGQALAGKYAFGPENPDAVKRTVYAGANGLAGPQ